MSTPDLSFAPLPQPAVARPLPLSQQVLNTIDKLIEINYALSNKIGDNPLSDNIREISRTLQTAAACTADTPILTGRGVTLACTRCGRLNAPAYYLKHSHGMYAVLCFSNGEGCWEHSGRANCSYIDQTMAQCLDLAEWVVAYGPDMLTQREVCGLHVPAVLSDVSEHRIFPLKD
jgi:hypothetical protein